MAATFLELCMQNNNNKQGRKISVKKCLGPTPTSSEEQIYFRVRNALALISRCAHFDTSKRVEKERLMEREKMKSNFLPKVTIPKRIKVNTLTNKGGGRENKISCQKIVSIKAMPISQR